MATAVQSLGLCLRACQRRATLLPRTGVLRPTNASRRPITTTPVRWRESKDEADGVDEALDTAPGEANANDTPPQRELTAQDHETVLAIDRSLGPLRGDISRARPRMTRPIMKHQWNEDESDPDMINTNPDAVEAGHDISSMGHGKLDEFREFREYARIAAWQMPLLSKLAKPFEPPTADEPLRFRYTTYMGEFHPAEAKVVVEFCPADLPLTEPQQLKLKKLLGVRFNPETEIAKISCEQFTHQAQNKRYLGDLVDSLIAQARDPTDMFEDVPLDTRHHKFKRTIKFPLEWRMTEERKKEIEDTRQKSLLLDQKKEQEGQLIDGAERIEVFLNPIRPMGAASRLAATASAAPTLARARRV